MSQKGQMFQKIPLEDRLKAVKAHIEEGQSYPYIAKKYGVSKTQLRHGSAFISEMAGFTSRKEDDPQRVKHGVIRSGMKF